MTNQATFSQFITSVIFCNKSSKTRASRKHILVLISADNFNNNNKLYLCSTFQHCL